MGLLPQGWGSTGSWPLHSRDRVSKGGLIQRKVADPQSTVSGPLLYHTVLSSSLQTCAGQRCDPRSSEPCQLQPAAWALFSWLRCSLVAVSCLALRAGLATLLPPATSEEMHPLLTVLRQDSIPVSLYLTEHP